MSVSLSAFIQSSSHTHANELSRIMSSLCNASVLICQELTKVGVFESTHAQGQKNIHGEVQKHLDVLANQICADEFLKCDLIAGFASEEEDSFVSVNTGQNLQEQYVVVIDPVDGSSNIDVNIPVGTIFSIYGCSEISENTLAEQHFLQGGRKQTAAGYFIYGAALMLVLTYGEGVHVFTYDPDRKEFIVVFEKIAFEAGGAMLSMNEGHINSTPDYVQNYVSCCKSEKNRLGQPYTMRYVGSFVADFHRNVFYNGIYLYPQNAKSPQGKLRLLYECFPIAYLSEQALGEATDGDQKILDLTPTDLHQTSPFYCGPTDMMEELKSFQAP